MALFVASPEERLEKMEVENEVLSHQKEMAEKRAVIQELRRKYGSGWRKLLGSDMSLSSLKSFLASSNTGMRRMYNQSGGEGTSQRMRTLTNLGGGGGGGGGGLRHMHTGGFRTNTTTTPRMPSPLPHPDQVK